MEVAMQIKKDSKSSGVALLTVIIFLLIIASLSATSLFIMTGSTYMSSHQVERAKAYYVAEAGLVYNLNRLAIGSILRNVTINLDGKVFTAIVTTARATVGSSNQFTVNRLQSSVNY